VADQPGEVSFNAGRERDALTAWSGVPLFEVTSGFSCVEGQQRDLICR
jgi:hypothetical protein